MAIALLLAAALAWWLHTRGELTPNLLRLAGSGAAALIALRLLGSGRPLMAIIVAGVGYAWWISQKPRIRIPAVTDEAAALAILGLSAGADAEAIQAAWRTRIAQVHPDAGGTDDAARAVTDARDLLLARL